MAKVKESEVGGIVFFFWVVTPHNELQHYWTNRWINGIFDLFESWFLQITHSVSSRSRGFPSRVNFPPLHSISIWPSKPFKSHFPLQTEFPSLPTSQHPNSLPYLPFPPFLRLTVGWVFRFCSKELRNPFPSPSILLGQWWPFWRVDAATDGGADGRGKLAQLQRSGGEAAERFRRSVESREALWGVGYGDLRGWSNKQITTFPKTPQITRFLMVLVFFVSYVVFVLLGAPPAKQVEHVVPESSWSFSQRQERLRKSSDSEVGPSAERRDSGWLLVVCCPRLLPRDKRGTEHMFF